MGRMKHVLLAIGVALASRAAGRNWNGIEASLQEGLQEAQQFFPPRVTPRSGEELEEPRRPRAAGPTVRQQSSFVDQAKGQGPQCVQCPPAVSECNCAPPSYCQYIPQTCLSCAQFVCVLPQEAGQPDFGPVGNVPGGERFQDGWPGFGGEEQDQRPGFGGWRPNFGRGRPRFEDSRPRADRPSVGTRTGKGTNADDAG